MPAVTFYTNGPAPDRQAQRYTPDMAQVRLPRVPLVCAVAALSILAETALRADRADKREILKQAKASYYSLRARGLESFEATLTPDWQVVLSVNGNPPPQAQLDLLSVLRFSMSLDAAGKTRVTYRAEKPAPNDTVQKGYDQIFTGMDDIIAGFYQTYTPFMITSPFPAIDSQYQVDDTENGYFVTWKEDRDTTSVSTRMTRTLAITDMVINSKDFDALIKPTFSTGSDGYVLSAYNGYYKPKAGGGTVLIDVAIEHQLVEGFRLVKKLAFSSAVDGAPSKTEIAFSNYSIKRK